jgi:hypothetical protein
VPVVLVPPVTFFGENVTDKITGPFTVTVVATVTLPRAAVIVTTVGALTWLVFTVKDASVYPDFTLTLEGTVTDGSELLSATATPELGATPLRATVPTAAVPPTTVGVFNETPISTPTMG